MATQGPNNPATAADDSSVGSKAWANPGNCFTSNNVYATVQLGDFEVSHYLKATNYSFSIPAGSTINGIQVDIERKRNSIGGGIIIDNSVKLVKGGVISGNDLKAGINWPTVDTVRTYGNTTSQLWGLSWTATDINASNFGIALACNENGGSPVPFATGSVDVMTITVGYTLPVPPLFPFWFYTT